VHVGRPVGGVTRGEVSEVVAFQCFEDFTTTRCDEPGSPVSVFCIVVATRDEPGPESSEKVFELRFADRMFGRDVDSRKCEVADGVFHRHTSGLKVVAAAVG
jgi:hypothetical protein